jgi:hypothetical protein
MALHRRTFLAAASASAVALAGCSGSSSSSEADCVTSSNNPDDDHPVIESAFANTFADSKRAVLTVAIDPDAARENDVVRIRIARYRGNTIASIPFEDDENPPGEVSQTIGVLPQHGELVVAAEIERGEPVDYLKIEFNCPSTQSRSSNRST